MEKWFRLFVVCLIVPGAVSAQLANTYKLQAGVQSGVVSKVAIDITAHGPDSLGVYLATSRGANFSFDGGTSWFVADLSAGLPSENLSAIFSMGDRLWLAGNHNELISGALLTLSDGLTYSDDDGATWTQVNFGPNGLNIPFVWGGDRSIFDISGHTDLDFLNNRIGNTEADWMFFTAFAGGLLASMDGGTSWRRIYSSPADSVQFNNPNEAPSFRNRYFACAVDTSHSDTLTMWAGTAGGIFQYIYVPPNQKLFSRIISRIAFCDTCSAADGSTLFIAGESGLSRTLTSGGPFTTRFESDGLPGPNLTAVINLGKYLLVGTADSLSGTSTGLALSTDGGESFNSVPLPEVIGANRTVSDFVLMNDRLYMAAQQAGLFVSTDTGQTWEHILVDSADALAAVNIVNAVGVLKDTLLVGTDSGYVELRLDNVGDIISRFHQPFVEDDSSSARITRVKSQPLEIDTLPGMFEPTGIWSAHQPLTESGTPMVGYSRWLIDTIFDTTIVGTPPDDTLKIDTTIGAPYFETQHFQVGVVTHDMNFVEDTAWVVGEMGIRFTFDGTNPSNIFSARQFINDTLVVATLDDDTVTTMEVMGDTIVFGTRNGLAISTDRGKSFGIHRVNTDSLGADLTINHGYINTLGEIAGDFIPALGVQYTTGPAMVWAGARPVNDGVNGISVGEFRTIRDAAGDSVRFGLVWQRVHQSEFAWNFEFFGNTIFAATNSGLLRHDGARDGDGKLTTDWETIDLINVATGEVLVASGTPAFSVGIVDSFLWVGTDDGTVKIRLDDMGDQELFARVDQTTADDEVYAFPVPFRPDLGGEVDFRFVVKSAGTVTVEVYDFAMNLVATPIDGIFFDVGSYPEGSSQGISWDGRNDDGEVVAVGIYYFKVEQASGEVRWGKLAVIP